MAESSLWHDNAYSVEEKNFHDLVRDWVISLLVLLLLLSASYGMLLLFRREPEIDDFSASDKEDTVVYHAAFVICVFTLSAAFSCTLLLPASVACNEILLMYPDSYYLQWINGSLVSKFWDLTFYFSRALIFLLLPFIYLFTEAIGFVGMRYGVMARVYEAVAVMILVSFVLFGLFFLGMALVYSYEELFISDVWRFLDRLVTALGFVFLLISTPIGYAAVFISAAAKSLPFIQRRPNMTPGIAHSSQVSTFNLSSATSAADRCDVLMMEKELLLRRRHVPTKSHNGDLNSSRDLEDSRFDAINRELRALQQQLETKRSRWRSLLSWLRHFLKVFEHLSPLLCAFLTFGLAVLSALSTAFTVLERALTSRTLTTYDEELRLGHESLSRLGIFGSTLGLILQLSCALAALVGIYNLPLIRRITPRRGDTPMTCLILNCAIWILLAQAFPSFSSCLGLTNFQLLSGFRISSNWLLLNRSSVYIVVIIDATYIAFVVLQLVNSLTAPLVRDFVAFIVARWHRFRRWVRKETVHSNQDNSNENSNQVPEGMEAPSSSSVIDDSNKANNSSLKPSPSTSSLTIGSSSSNNIDNANPTNNADNSTTELEPSVESVPSKSAVFILGSPNSSANLNLNNLNNSNDLRPPGFIAANNTNHHPEKVVTTSS